MAEPLPRLSAALADRYRIERELGAGGMATVYLAEDLKHRRKVAIKVLRPSITSQVYSRARPRGPTCRIRRTWSTTLKCQRSRKPTIRQS
jgi:serine/threonine protein kinase